MLEFLKVLWFLLPAGFATMTPVFAKLIFPKFKYPVDFGKTFRGKRIFGPHKTWRGIISGIIIGWLIFKIQQILFNNYAFFQNISLFSYQEASDVLGFLMGLGALLGDLVKSFFKRQFGIKPGTSWFPFDQIDWILGLVIFSLLRISISLSFVILLTLSGIVLHLIVKAIGYFTGINKYVI